MLLFIVFLMSGRRLIFCPLDQLNSNRQGISIPPANSFTYYRWPVTEKYLIICECWRGKWWKCYIMCLVLRVLCTPKSLSAKLSFVLFHLLMHFVSKYFEVMMVPGLIHFLKIQLPELGVRLIHGC